MKNNSKRYRYLFTLSFNIALFYLLYLWIQKNVHPHLLLQNIKQINIYSLFFALFLYFPILTIYGIRLSLLMSIPYKKAMCIVGISNGINHILPFRMGDILRIYFAKQFYNIEISRTIAATFMERYYDLIILLLFGLILLFSHQYGADADASYLFSMLLSCSLLSIFFYRYLIVKDGYLKAFAYRFKRIKQLLLAIEEIIGSKNKLRITGLSTLIWLAGLFLYYVFFKVNLGQPAINLLGALFMLFATTLMFAVPYTFGGTGVFEAAIVYYLIQFHHSTPTEALALALVFHFTVAIPQIVVMAFFLIVNRARWFKPVKQIKASPTH